MFTVAFHFLGCRLNEAENEFLARAFVEAGHAMVDLEDHPDVIVLNTCGVTADAMRKSRNLARRMAALRPRLLVLMGCAMDLMADGEYPLSDDELVSESGTDMQILRILKKDKANAAPLIIAAMEHLRVMERGGTPLPPPVYRLRIRSFIKIQDGCNNRCTYCAVRLARGPERSESTSQILGEIQKCLALGEKEIVLTGVQLGAWREEQRRLPDLIKDILSHTDVKRLRLGSVEPWHVRPELWELWKDRRLCPHFHIPVQSGSDTVLTAMCRRTSIEGYLQKMEAMRAAIPNLRISTDLIVGFPGETETAWHETLDFIQKARFDEAHLFRFSPRPNTIAASLPNPVPPDIKRKRWNEAQSLIQSIRRDIMQKSIGAKHEVLWENIHGTTDNGAARWSGYSENYLRFIRAFPAGKMERGTVTTECFGEADLANNLEE